MIAAGFEPATFCAPLVNWDCKTNALPLSYATDY